MMVEKILSEKKRKKENRRRFFINEYFQSQKMFGNAVILPSTRGMSGIRKGEDI